MNIGGVYISNIKGIVMKQFNLEEYLANPNRKVVTRGGSPARIICTNRKGNWQPILALIQVRANTMEVPLTFSTDGKYDIGRESNYDLFFTPEKHEGWINVYLDAENDGYVGTCIYKSKEKAEESGKKGSSYITTLKIEWEE